MAQPEIAILVSTFERPQHLRRVLASIAAQQGVRGAIEVVVTDDGSRDDTPLIVRDFAASASFPVHFTSHPHAGFHIARCRNEGAGVTSAPYLLFLDGDCIIPPDHVRKHLNHRRDHTAIAGYPIYLSRETSEQVTTDEIARAAYLRHVRLAQRLQMRWRHLRGRLGQLLGDPQRPKLLGGNLGIARIDYERINGYDENFHGWGCEDDDLRVRLRAAGVQVASIAWWTNTYHLWHPKTPSAPSTWREGANVEYLKRPLRLTRCLTGIEKRRLQDVAVRISGQRIPGAMLGLLPAWCRIAAAATNERPAPKPELEIVFAGQQVEFTQLADCRVLIALGESDVTPSLAAAADAIFAPQALAAAPKEKQYLIADLVPTLETQLGLPYAAAAKWRAA
jgi:glycosyltransferase involved in cell wall biosynthesis